MDSITDANETNRYLVYVGPGVYTVIAPIQLKTWVTLKGSGEDATLLTGVISGGGINSGSAIIVGASHATITEMSVENTGGGSYSIEIYNDIYNNGDYLSMSQLTVTVSGGSENNYAVYNHSTSSTMSHMTVSASGGSTKNYAIYNKYCTDTNMADLTVNASGGSDSRGIYNERGSSPTMTNLTVRAYGASGNNYSIYNYHTDSPTMNDITTTASGGVYSYGVKNYEAATPTMTNVTAIAGGNTYSYGIDNYSNSAAIMNNVKVKAMDGDYNFGIRNYNSYPIMNNVTVSSYSRNPNNNYGIYNEGSSSPKIYHSTIKAKTDEVVGGTPVCHYTLGIVGSTYTELNTSCGI